MEVIILIFYMSLFLFGFLAVKVLIDLLEFISPSFKTWVDKQVNL